jgi:site-specific recombinase XerD
MELHELIKRMSEENQKDLDLKTVSELYLNNQMINRSKGTYRHDRDHLGIIIKYLDERNLRMVSELNTKIIQQFVAVQKRKELSNITINKRTNTLRKAIDYSIQEGYIDSNPINTITKLKEVQKQIQVIPEKIYKQVFNYLNTTSDPWAMREKTILYMYLENGIRLSEIVALNLENFNFEDNTVILHKTKINTERTIPFSHALKNQLLKYIENYKVKNGPMFVSRYGERLTDNAIKLRLNRLQKKLNIPISISSHKWRHTCGTLNIEDGANIIEVKKLLGHKSIKTTEKYIHLSDQSVETMVKNNSAVKKLEIDF